MLLQIYQKKKTVIWHNSSSLSVIYIYIYLINQCFIIKFVSNDLLIVAVLVPFPRHCKKNGDVKNFLVVCSVDYCRSNE